MPRAKIDAATIEWHNGEQRARIEYFREIIARIDDCAERRERLALQECVLCYKGGRIGTAVMTSRPCAFCGYILHSGNSNIDAMCANCAHEAGLCKHCGADMDFKNRRKRALPSIDSAAPSSRSQPQNGN